MHLFFGTIDAILIGVATRNVSFIVDTLFPARIFLASSALKLTLPVLDPVFFAISKNDSRLNKPH